MRRKKRKNTRGFRCFLEICGHRVAVDDPKFPFNLQSRMEELLNGDFNFVAAPKRGDLIRYADSRTGQLTVQIFKPRQVLFVIT